MQHHVELLDVSGIAFEIAGIACRVQCRDRSFLDFLSARYGEFASHAPPRLSVRVEVTGAWPDDAGAPRAGPFARIGGADGLLSIEGPGFRGEFDERSGHGWISQPRDPSPLEAFLTAIYAGRLLKAGGFFLHAAGLVGPNGARVCFGPSGSGKTTVAGLVGEGVISDETVAVRREGLRYRVSGVPWRGCRLSAPLAGLFRLRKARATSFTPLSPVEALRQLLPSVLFSRTDLEEMNRFLEIGGEMARRVPCYEMRFAPDRSFWHALPRLGEGEDHGRPL